jgi:hypothetical protein
MAETSLATTVSLVAVPSLSSVDNGEQATTHSTGMPASRITLAVPPEASKRTLFLDSFLARPSRPVLS